MLRVRPFFMLGVEHTKPKVFLAALQKFRELEDGGQEGLEGSEEKQTRYRVT